MRERWDLAPAAARARGDAGDRRPHQQWVRFNDRGKRHVIVNAIACEFGQLVLVLAVMEVTHQILLDSRARWRQRVE